MKFKSLVDIVKENSSDIWSFLVPKEFLSETCLVIDKETAIIYTKDQIYANELSFFKDEYLDAIQKKAKEVKSIKIIVNPKRFKEEKVVIRKSEKKFESVLNEKKKEAEKIFSNIQDIDEKKYLVSCLALKLVKEYYSKENKEKKCENCGDYFKGPDKICIICRNIKRKKDVQDIIKYMLDDPYLRKEYFLKILSYDELTYDLARDEVLRLLYLKLQDKYRSGKDYEKELRDYLVMDIKSPYDLVLNLEGKKIIKRLETLFGGERNEKNT